MPLIDDADPVPIPDAALNMFKFLDKDEFDNSFEKSSFSLFSRKVLMDDVKFKIDASCRPFSFFSIKFKQRITPEADFVEDSDDSDDFDIKFLDL